MDIITATILSACISGVLSAAGAFMAVLVGFARLEPHSRRTTKIDCVSNIFGFRWLLSPRPKQFTLETLSQFNNEINKISILFADDRNVRDALTTFQLEINEANFKRLLRCLCNNLGIKDSVLTDTYLTQNVIISLGSAQLVNTGVVQTELTPTPVQPAA